MTPFQALYGRKAVTPNQRIVHNNPKLKDDVREELARYHDGLKVIQKSASVRYQLAQECMKSRYDCRAKEKEFRPGDSILMKIMRLKKGQSTKFSDKFHGLYIVMSRVSLVNYVVRSEDTKKYKTVHVNRLKLCGGEEGSIESSPDSHTNTDTDSTFEGFSTVSSNSEEEVEEETKNNKEASRRLLNVGTSNNLGKSARS